MRRMLIASVLAGILTLLAAPIASTAPLPENCTKVRGTVTCFEGPGNNQAGVGSFDETQGNTTNKSPEPQELECTQRPPKAQGDPITCP